MIEHSLKRKLNSFPTLTNKDNKKLHDLVDILSEVESAMVNPSCSTLLSYFNSSSGVSPIVSKIPYSLQDKWVTRASTYKHARDVSYPPFTIFIKFIKEMCEIRNDPAFSQSMNNQANNKQSKQRLLLERLIFNLKTWYVVCCIRLDTH